MEPRDIVQAAIDAYHAHDLDRCMGFYASDILVKQIDGTVLMDGADAVRARYGSAMVRHPNLHYASPNRIALGDFVIDEESITGATGATGATGEERAVLIYRFEAGLIKEILIIS